MSNSAFPSHLEPERADWLAKLKAADNEDDPLDVWLGYINWLDTVCIERSRHGASGVHAADSILGRFSIFLLGTRCSRKGTSI